MHNFDIYFAGEVVAGKNPADVKSNIGQMFKLSGSNLEALFSGSPVRIKTNLKAEEAGKYRQAFLNAGGLISVVPAGSEPPVPERAPAFSSQPGSISGNQKDDLQLFPANTGSLIDTATPRDEYNLALADQFSLSPAGALLPESSAPAAFNLDDISHIEVMPANTGSLEEFEMPKKPVDVPDTSNLHTVDGGNLSDGTEQPAAADIPSTDHLQASQPNTGSLEDCVEEKTPAKIPDIGGIQLID